MVTKQDTAHLDADEMDNSLGQEIDAIDAVGAQ